MPEPTPDIDAVVVEATRLGADAATAFNDTTDVLWTAATTAWHDYWLRPEVADLPGGLKGQLGSLFLVAYTASRVRYTAVLQQQEAIRG